MENTKTPEYQRRLRMRLALYAYAYEFESDSLIGDHEYDRLSFLVDTSIETGNALMDAFFREHFDPSTGMWIHRHPELNKVRNIYNTMEKHNG